MCENAIVMSSASSYPTTIEPLVETAKFSFFNRPVRNAIPNGEMTLLEAYHLIKGNEYQWQTALLRSLTDKDQARSFKAENFDYACFSGVFTWRNARSLVQHSGLIALDLDHVTDLQRLRKALLKDLFFETQLLFVSPSGDGLKWIVPIDLGKASQLDWFNAISNYVSETYQFKLDASGKDVPRACFLPHDPEVYIHPRYLTSSISQPFQTNSYANN